MTPLELALRYMDIFFSGRDLARLHDILAADLRFRGPFHRFETARDYVESLVASPPVQCSYHMLHTFEHERHAQLTYEFIKPGVRTPMAQLFETRDARIVEMVLVFDSAAFR